MLLALALGLMTLGDGLALDDLLILDGVREGSGPLAGFDFVGGAATDVASGRAAGSLPWWTSDALRVRFLRPLGVLTHQLDMLVWPGHPARMHVHSALWYALLVALVGALYRVVWRDAGGRPATRWVPALALLLYAIDDAHGINVGWLATRHSLVGGALAVGALLAYVRGRGGWRSGVLVAPLLLALALLASETALAVWGYFVAHAFTLERQRGWRGRLRPLWPLALVTALWLALYLALGAGAAGCGLYVDPTRDPLGFGAQTLMTGVMLVAAQLGVPGVLELMVFVPGALVPAAVVAAAGVGVVAWILRPLLRRSATARFWALGMALATAPHGATMPADRYLLLIGLGGAGLVSCVIAALARGQLRRWPARALAWAWIVLHVVLAALLFVPRAHGTATMHAVLERAALALPDADDVVLINAPGDLAPLYAAPIRARARLQHPGVHVLYAGGGALEVTRVDADTLSLRAPDGWLAAPGDQVFRARAHAMRPGARIELGGVELTLESVDEHGAPRVIIARFPGGLERARVFAWIGGGPVEFDAPAPGQTRTIAPVAWDFSAS